MTGLMVVEGEALEGAPQSALAESLNSIADHAIMLNVGTQPPFTTWPSLASTNIWPLE